MLPKQLLTVSNGQSYEIRIQIVISLNYREVRGHLRGRCGYIYSQWHYLYTSSMQLVFSIFKITFALPLYAPTPIAFPSTSTTSRSICGLFLCLSIIVPWFPWDWVLSEIMPEGGLSMDPLGSTALCLGSEVWEMWCIWPQGCTSLVFSDDLPVACGPKVHSGYIHTCKHTSTYFNNSTCSVGNQSLLNACNPNPCITSVKCI